MNKSYCFVFLSFFLVNLSGCAVPYDIKPWRVGAINSSYYGTSIDLISGRNKKEILTMKMPVYLSGDTVKWSNDKHKFSLHLDPKSIRFINQLIPEKNLPESIYIAWKSDVEGEFYDARLEITPKIRAAMVKPRSWVGGDKDGDTCYQNDIVFGLLPGGDAKVWLSGCNRYTFIGRIESSGGSRNYPNNVIFIPYPNRHTKDFLVPYTDHIEETEKIIKYTNYDELK